tara:strand:- start:121 stop:243 length:123 start_codon:yes stop_codon:yes gene_type:complete
MEVVDIVKPITKYAVLLKDKNMMQIKLKKLYVQLVMAQCK